jgi:hypothetical protein
VGLKNLNMGVAYEEFTAEQREASVAAHPRGTGLEEHHRRLFTTP